MRALYAGNRSFTVTEAPPQQPAAGQVRIDVAYTGLCGTDLHIMHGDMDHRVAMPAVIGHEMSGRIAEIGPDVAGWQVGDPVTVMPLVWCDSCPACSKGHRHICHNLNFVGIDSTGSMQSSWTVAADLLVRLPDELPLEHGALLEPTAVAVHDVRRGAVQPHDKVVVVGAGPVGLLIALVARSTGADVTILELDATRRAFAEEIGFIALDPATDDIAEYLDQWTAGAGADVAFEVSGSAGGVAAATQALAVRGRLVMVAIHSTPRPVDLFRFFWRELTLVGARVYDRDDFDQAIALVQSGQVPVGKLISRIVPLAQVTDAFAALESGGVVKVLIDCRCMTSHAMPAF